ncbi:hypothetical protein HY251_02220 [bacterium]|nr:hypothetical protein [bacterium]
MDESLRSLERAVLFSPGDEAAARAYLAALARAQELEDEGPRDAPPLGGRAVLGPLLPEEAERIRELEPSVLVVDGAGVGWSLADSARGRAVHAATIKLRLLELERVALGARASFAAWFGINAALDAGGSAALEKLAHAAASPESLAAEKVVRLLAATTEAAVGRRLAHLAREVPVEARPRLYDALANGRVPLDEEARALLSEAIARELPALRTRACAALFRGASQDDLARYLESGPPEVRAKAFERLVGLLPMNDAKAHELVRHAILDDAALVRKAAVRLLSGDRWSRHARAAEWAIGRLTDRDRGVRAEAARVLRRVQVPKRLLPRLQLVVESAPPGIRPGLRRLLERIEKKA